MKRKKILKQIWLFMAVICLVNKVHSQRCPDTSEIRTNFTNPFNTQFNSVYPSLTNPFINKYDWSGYRANVGFDDLNLNPNAGWDPLLTGIIGGVWKMASPFSSRMGSDYSYLYTINGKIPTLAELPYLGWAPERGWELMWMQTGYLPDLREINNSDNKSFLPGPYGLANEKLPYIILYNRYTGKMRLFANLIAEFGMVDQIVTYLQYDISKRPDVSGIFRNVANYDRPLDMPTVNRGATVYNKNSNNNRSWYSNDIQLGFDPCVCEYPTYLDLSLKTMKSLNVNLYGRYLQLTVPVNQIEKDFLTQSSINQDAQSGNSLIYKKTQLMYEDYIRQLEDYNRRLKDYNSLENDLKAQVLGWGRDLVISAVGSAFPLPALRNFIVANAITLKGKPFPDTTTAEGWAKAAREASKGLMGKGFDYLTQDFVMDKPTAPVMPSATLGELRMTGTIDDDNKVDVTNLYTPGSFKMGYPVNIFDYPIFNKPTGLFALLEKPKLRIYNGHNYSELPYNHLDPHPGATHTRLTMKRTHDFRMKFTDALRYKYNYGVKIDKQRTTTFVSFIVEYEHDYNVNDNTDVPNACYYLSVNNGMRIKQSNLKLLHAIADNSTPKLYHREFETEWIPMQDLKYSEFNLEFIDTVDVPISSISNCQYHKIWSSTNHKIRSIKMKIMTDIYFLDNPEINSNQVFTYLVFDSENSENETSVLSYAESVDDYNKYHSGEISLNKDYVTPTHPLVTSINGSDMYIDGAHIAVNGPISVANGYKLHIRSLNEVVINPEIVFVPEISIETVKNFSMLKDFGELSDVELSEYCRGSNKRYNANTSLGKAPLKFEDIADEIKDKPETQTRMVFYPNPANSELYIHLSDEADYNYQLFDITSRPVLQGQIQAGKAGMVNISQAQEGIYILRVEGKGHVFTQKVIIKH